MSKAKTKIVFIGNSIVNGFPHKRSECFVSLFRELTDCEVINKGVNGDTTAQIRDRFHKDVLSHRPSLVYILTGTNDFIYDTATPSEAVACLADLAEIAAEHKIKVIILTPLMVEGELAERYWLEGTDYNAVSLKLADLRDQLLKLEQTEMLSVIDTQSFYSSLYSAKNAGEYIPDGIHPTIAGHKALAEFLKTEYLKKETDQR